MKFCLDRNEFAMNLIQHFPRSKLNLFYVTYIELRLVLLCGLQSLLSFKSRFFTPARTLVAVFYFIKIHYSLDSLRKYNENTNMKQKTELLNLLDLAFVFVSLCKQNSSSFHQCNRESEKVADHEWEKSRRAILGKERFIAS